MYRPTADRAPVAEAVAFGFAARATTAELAVAKDGQAAVRCCPVAAVGLREGLAPLLRMHLAEGAGSAALQTYARAARLALGLVVEQQIAPVLHVVAVTESTSAVTSPDGVVAGWRALLPIGGQAAGVLAGLAAALPAPGHALPTGTSAVWQPYALLRAFVDAVVDGLARDATVGNVSGRPRARLLPWTARWREAAIDPRNPLVPLGAQQGEVVAGVREWLRPFEQPLAEHTPHLMLQLPDAPDGDWTLRFGLRDGDGRALSAAQVWREDAGHSDRVEALLESLARAARVFPPIEHALDERHPAKVRLGTGDAWQFIDQTARSLEDAGYRVDLPDDLVALRPRLQLGSISDEDGRGDTAVTVTWQATIGDEVVDADTVDQVLDPSEPLLFFGDRWVWIAPEVRTQWEQRARDELHVPLIEALGMAVAGVATGPGRLGASDTTQVTAVGPLATLVDRLRYAATRSAITPPEGFCGDLRAYQLDAVGWLDMMADLQLGAVLADDMGLGKTVMLIAHLLRLEGPHLVVCPTSVVANWEREVGRFAPGLIRHRHHGPSRSADLSGASGVVITSYGTLRRDIDMLSAVDWQVVTLDEAQQVKNPDTLGARAVRRLRSAHCVALTGTPVENRLRELWSVLDLTNPGLLGARARFERRYANPIERRGDPVARGQLRRLIAPFVLRRTKSDPRVAPDLPPRIERTVPCTLTDQQRNRYEAAVRDFRRSAADHRSAMQHRGAVLALLTRLKQICDHPALGARATGRPMGRSGKLAVAHQLVLEATQAGERVLVFTQFVRMAEILADELSHALQTTIPVLHGGLSATARQRIVDRFQGKSDDDPPPPVLIASLRAGGTGMNLTAATQVIHYDRWWNPAVEDQASDRAHRIGQTERVLIHRLVTMGTVEEHIDAMLETKRQMADAVVGAGETWITELAMEQVLELVELSDDEPARRPGQLTGSRP